MLVSVTSTYWKNELEKALDHAEAALLLVSPDYLASQFIKNIEIPRLLKAAASKGLKIYWVHLRSCFWEATELYNFQPIYSPEKPLNALSKHASEAAITEIVRTLHKDLTA